jgi:hypothetical protein
MKNILLIIFISFSISSDAFSMSHQNDAVTPFHGEETEEVGLSNKEEKSPCNLISEKEIKRLFSIPENVETEIENTLRTYPTCFYKWESIKFSETKKFGNNEISIDYPTELTIVLVKNATEKSYEASIKAYRDGQSQNGIGEMATWGGQMSQITFLSHGYLIHVHAKKSAIETENKEIAIKIAELIINKL